MNRALLQQALEALKDMNRAYVNLLATGRDRIIQHGGTCGPVDVMERGDPSLIKLGEFMNELRAELAKPARQPMPYKLIHKLWTETLSEENGSDFLEGFRAAERHYGIGVIK